MVYVAYNAPYVVPDRPRGVVVRISAARETNIRTLGDVLKVNNENRFQQSIVYDVYLCKIYL